MFRAVELAAARGGQAMNPISVYWETAKAGTWPAIEAEFRRRAFKERPAPRPRLERRRAQLAILTHVLEREENE